MSANMNIPRVGTGFDVHAFADPQSGREMWLAGLFWPGVTGLEGHSDADVAAHAACDAIFAAAGLGDVGKHFGTCEPTWAGAPGATLLEEAARRVRAAGFEIGNISIQVVGNAPKVGSRRAESERVLSEACGAPVNVAGTTTDGLGLTGRNEGVAAIATALVVAVGDDESDDQTVTVTEEFPRRDHAADDDFPTADDFGRGFGQ
ncbi:2-C-methyl-D-erythritol 2,4-cyclodiphosphate synthase [Micrococcales bacterium 31B]|nr:2-C-methyl-D-erythritol 2,4-cyclodiphosphate synthase [Micrococcales bacterium 31B]